MLAFLPPRPPQPSPPLHPPALPGRPHRGRKAEAVAHLRRARGREGQLRGGVAGGLGQRRQGRAVPSTVPEGGARGPAQPSWRRPLERSFESIITIHSIHPSIKQRPPSDSSRGSQPCRCAAACGWCRSGTGSLAAAADRGGQRGPTEGRRVGRTSAREGLALARQRAAAQSRPAASAGRQPCRSCAAHGMVHVCSSSGLTTTTTSESASADSPPGSSQLASGEKESIVCTTCRGAGEGRALRWASA